MIIAQISWNIDALMVFAIFFIPGFVTLSFYNFFSAKPSPKWSESFFEVVAYSIVNFIILYPIGFLIKHETVSPLSWISVLINWQDFYSVYGSWCYYVLLIVALLIAPILWSVIFIQLMKYRPERLKIQSILKPWDYMFSKDEGCFVLVHLKNKKTIAGKYSTKSFASSYPANEQIYLEEVWKRDANGQFVKKINNEGMLIFGDEISSIEFLK